MDPPDPNDTFNMDVYMNELAEEYEKETEIPIRRTQNTANVQFDIDDYMNKFGEEQEMIERMQDSANEHPDITFVHFGSDCSVKILEPEKKDEPPESERKFITKEEAAERARSMLKDRSKLKEVIKKLSSKD